MSATHLAWITTLIVWIVIYAATIAINVAYDTSEALIRSKIERLDDPPVRRVTPDPKPVIHDDTGINI